MNNIIIEFCAEDRARLDKIAELLERNACATHDCVEKPRVVTQNEAPKANAQSESIEQTTPAADVAADVKTSTVEATKTTVAIRLSDIQQLVVKLATSGKKAEARDVVTKYATRVTELPESAFEDVYAKLKALEA